MPQFAINLIYLGLGIWLAALMTLHIKQRPQRLSDFQFMLTAIGLQFFAPLEIKTAFWLWLGMTGALALFGFEYLVRWSERQDKSTSDQPKG